MQWLLGAVFLLAGESFQAKVISVADGDTLTVLRDGRAEAIRLNGIDAPERRQPFSARSRQTLDDLVYGKVVRVVGAGKDRYGRTLGDVYLPDGRLVNHELVRAGAAWWYRKYAPRDRKLEALELEAREGRRGLWADQDPVAPWAWRSRR